MKNLTTCSLKSVLLTAFVLFLAAFASQTRAADLPLAAASPLTGVAFDDRPLLLPVQRNFQMAMLTAGSEMGRSCGKMEAYGWRMSQTEQGRVNQIFNNTVDRMRLMGYTITPQDLSSVSKDITLFTADHDNKHFIFLWSAGELGLVLNLCETSAPIPSLNRPAANKLSPSVQTFPVMDVVPAGVSAMGKRSAKEIGGFSPVGKWVGGYTCAQGYTGGTLEISHLRGQNFDGVFKFYPTIKNPTVPAGSYTIYGQYDNDSRRILINPGKWIQHPANFYNTVIVGGFDPIADSFSAYFQGISGCTSFEGHREGDASYATRVTNRDISRHRAVKKHKKVAAKKAATVTAPPLMPAADITPSTPVATDAPLPLAATPAPVPTPVPPAPKPAPIAAPPAAVPPPFAAAPVVSVPTVPSAPPSLPADDKGIVLPGSGK